MDSQDTQEILILGLTLTKTFHILNGDALLDIFPADIEGDKIILRECLIDGPIRANSLEEFIKTRATFIGTYPECSSAQYLETSVSEFKKIQSIPEQSEVHFWFEDDVFCQLNFWFAASLIKSRNSSYYWVRPDHHNQYGFAQHSSQQLLSLMDKKISLESLDVYSHLWKEFQEGNFDRNSSVVDKLINIHPFLEASIEALIELDNRPKNSLRTIMEDLETPNFGKVFQEFCKREAIYGFGDLQVKKMYDELLQE